MLRHPAVAGSFYPGNKSQLETILQQLIPDVTAPASAHAVILPHAGYVYSGGIAGETLAQVRVPKRVILLGPNHTGEGAEYAVSRASAWQTPLGPLELDQELARQLVEAIPRAEFDDRAHQREHSLEVLLPLLQWQNPAVRIVPICIRSFELAALLEFGSALGSFLQGADDVLLVGSSDMSHFISGREARDKDFLAIEQLQQLDPAELYRTVRQHRISMCGVAPCVSLLQACRQLGASKAELIRYGNSGDLNGDQSSVVGYAGLVIP
jgi:MEMO1 family protein